MYDKWVDALESGDFIKGQCYLKYEDTGPAQYCCLGVLAELQGMVDNYTRPFTDDDIKQYYWGDDETKTGYLPHNILNQKIQYKLSSVNDENIEWQPVIEVLKSLENEIVK